MPVKYISRVGLRFLFNLLLSCHNKIARPADSAASMWLVNLVFVTQQDIAYDEILAA